MNKIDKIIISLCKGFAETATVGAIVFGVIYTPFPYNYIGLALLVWALLSYDRPCERKKREKEEEIDRKIKGLKDKIERLEEKELILRRLQMTEHIFIGGFSCMIKGEELVQQDAREWAEENNYRYVETIENHGELWVKREIKKGGKSVF